MPKTRRERVAAWARWANFNSEYTALKRQIDRGLMTRDEFMALVSGD